MEIQTIFNPAALDIPEVKAALNKWAIASQWQDQLRTQMSLGGAVVIVGTANDTQIDAAAIVTLPQAFTDTIPWVVHFHNDGPRALTHKLVEGVLDFVRQSGYTAYKAFNQSGKPDKVWLRAFKQGGKPHFIGSAYTFDLTKDNVDVRRNSVGGSGSRDRSKSVRKGQGSRPAAKQLKARRSNSAVVSAARSNRGRKPR